MSDQQPRYTELTLPLYSYVPGHAPHPVSDPAGHMFGVKHEVPQPLQPDNWQNSEEYLFGIDLFNHGYYWESHEAWESLWHAANRRGPIADFLKGLIKLAAAGVKVREGNPLGVARHAKRSQELLSSVAKLNFCGLSIEKTTRHIQELINSADGYNAARPELLLDVRLILSRKKSVDVPPRS